MAFHLSTNGLEKLLRGEQIEIGGVRETVQLDLDDSALAKVTDRRMYEIFTAVSDPIHGLHY